MSAKPLRTRSKSASAERCLRPLGATIDMATPDPKTSNGFSVQGIFAWGFTKRQPGGRGGYRVLSLSGNCCHADRIPKRFLPTPWSPPGPSSPRAAVSSLTAFSARDVTHLQARDVAGLSLQAARLLSVVCGPAHGPDRSAPGRVRDSLGPDAPSYSALGALQVPRAKRDHRQRRAARGAGRKRLLDFLYVLRWIEVQAKINPKLYYAPQQCVFQHTSYVVIDAKDTNE